MSQFKRLLGFLRPYTGRFFAAVILMAVVGACEALTALLIRPVFDRVLGPESPAASRILLFQLPFNGRGIYLQDFIPSRIHNEWTVVALAIIGVTLVKGLSEFFATYFVNFIGHSSRSSQDEIAEHNSVVQETFTGIRSVKAFVMELFEVAKFKAATRRLLKTNLRWVRAQAATSPLMELLGAITIAGLLLYERNEILHRAQTAGGFVAFLYALIKMYEPIKRLSGVNNAVQQAVGASEEVFRYLEVPQDVAEKPDAVELPPFQDEIAIEQVDFDYQDGIPLLRNVNLRIRKGEVVAIVGSSGAAKGTLASLIGRFFDGTHGRILLDGYDVRDVKGGSLRGQIGLVTQEIGRAHV